MADKSNDKEHSQQPGIYVASRVVRADMWRWYRDTDGYQIISTWIDEDGEGQTASFAELWERVRNEIRGCKALVFYAHGVQDFPFKGALVEVGIALAYDKPVFVVLNDVMLDGRTLRPLGSWALDRRVKMCDSIVQALDLARGCARSAAAPIVTLHAHTAKATQVEFNVDYIAQLRRDWANGEIGGGYRTIDGAEFEALCNLAIRSLGVAQSATERTDG